MSKRKKSKLGLILIVAVLVVFARVMIDQQRILYAKENQRDNLQKKIEEQNRINEELNNQKKIMNTDEYAEKVARDELGMIKPGERVFVDVNK
ncbi:MAG: septum formation initiator family protein [Clostridia bacterium]|nr:septum formation initiator family protein [Clostridia bacterium]